MEILFEREGLKYRTGTLKIVFGRAEIEDIGPRIQKYLPRAEDAAKYVTWIRHGPRYYARWWGEKW